MHDAAGMKAVMVKHFLHTGNCCRIFKNGRRRERIFVVFAIRKMDLLYHVPTMQSGCSLNQRCHTDAMCCFVNGQHLIFERQVLVVVRGAIRVCVQNVAGCNFGTRLLCRTVQLFIVSLINHIIRIHKADPISLRSCQTRIAGRAYSAVRFVDDPDAAVLCCGCVAQGRTAIRGAIIHQNDLKIRKGLGKNGIDAFV